MSFKLPKKEVLFELSKIAQDLEHLNKPNLAEKLDMACNILDVSPKDEDIKKLFLKYFSEASSHFNSISDFYNPDFHTKQINNIRKLLDKIENELKNPLTSYNHENKIVSYTILNLFSLILKEASD